jgi:predicted SAM-dependent methyltransferase
MKLNVGCGGNILQGWVNRDSDMDIRKPLPFKNDSVDEILAEHVVEHVTGPEAYRFFKEAKRVLKEGGVLRVCVPELVRLSRDKAEDIIVNHGHLQVFCLENLQLMLLTAGFRGVNQTDRKPCDGHWKVIGEELDTRETLRVEAYK